jgi:excisionase family DNA binding protein
MNSNLDNIKARARLVLAADRWRELFQLLEKHVPALIAEVEQLHRGLAEAQAKRHEERPAVLTSKVAQVPARGSGESQLLTSKQFAHAIGVSESCIRRWILDRKIGVVKLGRLVRIPRAEVQRLIDEGSIPMRPSRGNTR